MGRVRRVRKGSGVREVPLGGQKAAGRVALVDDDDYETAMQYKWCVRERMLGDGRHANGPYAIANVRDGGRKTTVLLHTVLTGWTEVDHKDHNGLNCTRSNMREVTRPQNQANQRTRVGRKFKGVTWHAHTQRWQARITVNYKERYLGIFVSDVDAALAYDAAARAAWGQYAAVNFPEEQ